MKIEITYANNEQIWKLERIAAEHGYHKTEECYWVQIFENENGDHIVTTREEGAQLADPVRFLSGALGQPDGNGEQVSVDELKADLDTGDNGDALNDYRDSSVYICDAITEAADQRTSIYYCDILSFVREHPEALNDVVAEGLYDPAHNYDFYQHAQAAEYMTIERDIYDHLADSLMLAALDFIRYDLKRETIPAELAELLRGWCDDAENFDRMNDIPDRIREYFDEGDQP